MTRKRFLKDDWVALGASELAAKGPEALKLEKICETAGRTRGSFYHHFDSHTAFQMAIVSDWEARGTVEIATEIAEIDDPHAAMDRLNDLAMATDFRFELGIRELARRSPEIAAIVRRIDADRLSLLTTLYMRAFDIAEDTAKTVATCEYAAYSGMILMDPDMAEADQRHAADTFAEMARLYIESVTA